MKNVQQNCECLLLDTQNKTTQHTRLIQDGQHKHVTWRLKKNRKPHIGNHVLGTYCVPGTL